MLEPKLYSKYNDLQKADNLFVLNKFMRLIKWKDHDSVMDIGFGDGKFAMENLVPRFPKTFRKFVGCDISETMVKFAKGIYVQPKVDFIQLDISAENIPFHMEMEFDHIFSFYTLHWVPKQRQAFTNMYNMLKPGGDILLTFLVHNPVYDIYRCMSNNIKWQSYIKSGSVSPYAGCQEPDKTLEKLLIEIGFVSHVCRIEKRKFRFPSMDIFERSIIAVTPIISQIPSEEVSNYFNEFVQYVKNMNCVSVENGNNNDEAVNFEHKIFVVFASKPAEKL